jgi:hypothetical protein
VLLSYQPCRQGSSRLRQRQQIVVGVGVLLTPQGPPVAGLLLAPVARACWDLCPWRSAGCPPGRRSGRPLRMRPAGAEGGLLAPGDTLSSRRCYSAVQGCGVCQEQESICRRPVQEAVCKEIGRKRFKAGSVCGKGLDPRTWGYPQGFCAFRYRFEICR